MAYIKYKELTKYFNFSKEIDAKDLPGYVTAYLDDREKIFKAYKTFSSSLVKKVIAKLPLSNDFTFLIALMTS